MLFIIIVCTMQAIPFSRDSSVRSLRSLTQNDSRGGRWGGILMRNSKCVIVFCHSDRVFFSCHSDRVSETNERKNLTKREALAKSDKF